MKREISVEEKEYFKNYWIVNKERMYNRTKELYPMRKRREIVKKLNEGAYKSVPYLKMEKYNIVKNAGTGLYE